MDDLRAVLGELAADPDRLEDVDREDLPDVLSAIEGLRARVWARLSAPPASSENGATGEPETGDRMLRVEEAAEILDVDPRWLYDRSDDLPFARKLAPRTLRFSERGLYRWLETRRSCP